MKKNTILVLFVLLTATLLSTQAIAGSRNYKFSNFSTSLRSGAGKCVDQVDAAFAGSVTKTTFTGKRGSLKPANLNLTLGNKTDDNTPTGTDNNWAGSTNTFNGTGARNGILKLTITKADTASCADYNGTTVEFE